MELALSVEELHSFLDEVFPQLGGRIRATDLDPGRLSAEMHISDQDLRPGGTVSGPAMFTLADCAFYMAVLSVIGREALTVTSSCSINFLRKPEPGNLFAEARILKLGRKLAVGDVLIFSLDPAKPVAQASLTYAIPDRLG